MFTILTAWLLASAPALAQSAYCGYLHHSDPTTVSPSDLPTGGLPIVLIDEGDKAVYFYRNRRIDISLEKKGKNLVNKTERFSLEPQESVSGELEGSWTSGKKSFAVHLWGIEDVSRARAVFAAETLKSGSTEVLKRPARYASGFYVLEVKKYAKADRIAKLNALLDKKEGDQDPCGDLFFTQSGTVRLLSPDLLLDETVLEGMAPGAAYPLNGEGEKKLYDLSLGKKLGFDDLFLSPNKARQLFWSEDLKTSKAESEELEKLESLRNPSAKDKARIEELNSSCFHLYELSHPAIRVDEKGVSVAEEFPHAMSVCNGNWKTLPFASLRNILKKDSAVFRYLSTLAPLDQKQGGSR